MRVGLLIVATGRYIEFFSKLHESLEKHFLVGEDKSYWLFTDAKVGDQKDVHVVPTERKGFPGDTLFRYHYFSGVAEQLEKQTDALFYIDVDSLVVADVKIADLLSQKNLMAVSHPGFYRLSAGTPETRPTSSACVLPSERRAHYVCGGFNGGKTADFLRLSAEVKKMIDTDQSKGITAIWHDESYLNRYYVSNQALFNVLPPSYMYPETPLENPNLLGLPRFIIALSKDHAAYRGMQRAAEQGKSGETGPAPLAVLAPSERKRAPRGPDDPAGMRGAVARTAPPRGSDWWNQNLGTAVSYEEFAGWLGDANAATRLYFRDYIRAKGYRSILDVPSGLCMDWDELMRLGISYQGVDVTQKLVDRAKERGISVTLGNAEKLEHLDKSVDVAYSRHLVEHLTGFEACFRELIRVALREVLVIFFIPPSNEKENSIRETMDRGSVLYHNCYSKPLIAAFLKEQSRVKTVTWRVVGSEEILHLELL